MAEKESLSRCIVFRLKITLGVVDADRPKAVNWHVLHIEPVDCGAVVLGGRNAKIEGVPLRKAAPSPCGSN
jgi:hypothetical protein